MCITNCNKPNESSLKYAMALFIKFTHLTISNSWNQSSRPFYRMLCLRATGFHIFHFSLLLSIVIFSFNQFLNLENIFLIRLNLINSIICLNLGLVIYFAFLSDKQSPPDQYLHLYKCVFVRKRFLFLEILNENCIFVKLVKNIDWNQFPTTE